MAGFSNLKAFGAFLSLHFIIAFTCGLAIGVAAVGYGTMKDDPYASTYGVLFGVAGMVMIYLIKAMTGRY